MQREVTTRRGHKLDGVGTRIEVLEQVLARAVGGVGCDNVAVGVQQIDDNTSNVGFASILDAVFVGVLEHSVTEGCECRNRCWGWVVLTVFVGNAVAIGVDN